MYRTIKEVQAERQDDFRRVMNLRPTSESFVGSLRWIEEYEDDWTIYGDIIGVDNLI